MRMPARFSINWASPRSVERFSISASSHQIDTASRGFAMTKNGASDMRMSRKNPRTAAEIVNTAKPGANWPGFSRLWRRAARDAHCRPYCDHPGALACAQPLTFRQRLPRWCRERGRAIPPPGLFRPPHCRQRRTRALTRGLEAISASAARGARFAVISFHSLEGPDRQNLLPRTQRGMTDRTRMAGTASEPLPESSASTPRPMDASGERNSIQPRARSAKLRVVERI